MTNERTYSVTRVSNRDGSTATLARGIESAAAAAEIALRLMHLQESELGGCDEFIAEPE